ncbi:unnamed protein product [Lampetra fluviatilis]
MDREHHAAATLLDASHAGSGRANPERFDPASGSTEEPERQRRAAMQIGKGVAGERRQRGRGEALPRAPRGLVEQ